MRRIYEKYFPRLIDFQLEYSRFGLEGPILISVPDRFFSQSTRLVFVGQQTNRWCTGLNGLDEILKVYEEFDFGRHYNASPFWNVIRKFERAFSVSPYSSVWTNINRFDERGNRPNRTLETDLEVFDNLIVEELRLLKPDILIYFTGPSFDSRIQRIFPDSEFSVVDDLPLSLLSKITNKNLPKSTYRTHHPKSLRIRGFETNVIRKIVVDASG